MCAKFTGSHSHLPPVPKEDTLTINMKVFVALCIFAVIAAAQGAGLTAEQSTKLREYFKECLESSKVDKELITKARNGEAVDDPHAYEFFTCMFTKAQFINKDGLLDLDVIRAKVPSDIKKEDIDKVFSACQDVQKGPKEQIAAKAYHCYLTKTPVKIQLIAEA